MWLGLLDEAGHGSSLHSGTRTSEEPRSRGVRLVQLDVAAPVVARRARSRRSQEVREALRSRVVHDHAELVPHPNIELVVDTGLALVVAANNKVDVIVREGLVRPRRAANETGTGRVAVGVSTCTVLEVSRNAGRVNVHTEPVVDVLQVPPVRRAVLAAAADAEGRLVAVEEDETAARHEVARPGKRRAADERQYQRPGSKHITFPYITHCSFSIRTRNGSKPARAQRVSVKEISLGSAALTTEFRRQPTR